MARFRCASAGADISEFATANAVAEPSLRGRTPRTIDAYAWGLAEYLEMCERENVDPLTANRAHIAVYVRELISQPSRRGANVVSIDSGSGLANATIQQRPVPVRLFYDFLMEDGHRLQPGRPGPLYARPPTPWRARARPRAEADETALDTRRAAGWMSSRSPLRSRYATV
ncbi:hypothetical protein ACWF94_04995 [Streptomyces sp. NPDC055078]